MASRAPTERSMPPTTSKKRPREDEREALERERQERMARIRQDDHVAPHLLPNDAASQLAEPHEETEEEVMQRLLGISSFGSSQNTKVATNHSSAAVGVAQKHKARKYRQYMNRKNGFNRPLDNV